MADKKEENKKVKRPTALKRNIQSLKRKGNNRSFKASVSTAIRNYKDSLAKKDEADVKVRLNEVFSLMDRGVKKNIFKLNKASRVKAQMQTLASAK